MGDVRIPEHILEAAGRATVFQVLSVLNFAMAESGLTNSQVGKRLGWTAAKVGRLLTGKETITLREMGEMLWAIDGSTWVFSLKPREVPPPVPDEPILPSTDEASNDSL